jgi:hypothetical protein
VPQVVADKVPEFPDWPKLTAGSLEIAAEAAPAPAA